MLGDGEHISGYDPGVSEAILGEAAHLLRHLGFAVWVITNSAQF